MFRISEKAWFLLIDHQSSGITVRAQIMKARLIGTIVDANGAVVPGVKVVLTNLKQGFRRSGATNSKGIFILSLPSTFTVKAKLPELTTHKGLTVSFNINTQMQRNIEFSQIVAQTSDSRFLRDLAVRLVSHLILLLLILVFVWATGQLHHLFSS